MTPLGESLSNQSRPGPPRRKTLPHDVPHWVPLGATFFITVNCARRGVNQLASTETASELLKTILTRMELGQWYPRLVLFMPDHVHALIVFADDIVMKNVVRNWKRYTGRHLQIGWQRDFFDHRIRSAESLNEKWQYILDNPIRAELAATRDEWPFLWTDEDLQSGSA